MVAAPCASRLANARHATVKDATSAARRGSVQNAAEAGAWMMEMTPMSDSRSQIPTSPHNSKQACNRTTEAPLAEIVGPSGRVHYRRPRGDALIEQAERTPGYSVRFVWAETIERQMEQGDAE